SWAAAVPAAAQPTPMEAAMQPVALKATMMPAAARQAATQPMMPAAAIWQSQSRPRDDSAIHRARGSASRAGISNLASPWSAVGADSCLAGRVSARRELPHRDAAGALGAFDSPGRSPSWLIGCYRRAAVQDRRYNDRRCSEAASLDLGGKGSASADKALAQTRRRGGMAASTGRSNRDTE